MTGTGFAGAQPRSLSEPGWWTLRVFCGHEIHVESEMVRAGLSVFCPTFTQARRNRYGRKGDVLQVTRPLFPNYLFMRPAPWFRPSSFETSRTKITVLRGSSGRLLVSDIQMESVRTVAVEASRVAPDLKIRADDFVMLLRGVLRGEPAQVLRVRGQHALVALTQRAGRANILVNIADIQGTPLAT